MAKCITCGKEEDVEWTHGGWFINCDGDYVCSRACEVRYWNQVDWIGGVACQSEAACLAYLKGDLKNPYE